MTRPLLHVLRHAAPVLAAGLLACRDAREVAERGDAAPAPTETARPNSGAGSAGVVSPSREASTAPPFATSPPPPSLPAARAFEDGTYETPALTKHGTGASIIVQRRPGGGVRFQGYAQWISSDRELLARGGGVHVGEIDGEARVIGDHFEAFSNGCRVLFTFVGERRVKGIETGEPCGGPGASFTWDDYRRVGSAKFQE